MQGTNGQIPVVAITGSSGKTTTKEMVASILSQKWRVLKSFGNNNAPTHIRKLLTRLTPNHKACVLEFGASRQGMIAQHCRIKKPTIGIITLLGTAHIGKFGGLQNLIATKSELIAGMNPHGLLILNRDDPRTPLLDMDGFRGSIVYFGMNNPCDYRGRDAVYVRGGMRFTVNLDGTDHRFFIPTYGRHNVYNALAAIAAARHLGFSAEHIRRGLATYFRAHRRLRLSKGIKGTTVIDDTYSASPEAVLAAIDVLSRLKGRRRAVAVLGGMAELGSRSEHAHREVGRYLVQRGIDQLITVGSHARWIRRSAISSGLSPSKAVHFSSLSSAIPRIRELVPRNSIVLFKASHRYGFPALVWRLRVKKQRER